MSGTYSVFLLRLVVVTYFDTTNSRNILYLFVTDNQVLLLDTCFTCNSFPALRYG